MANFTRQRQIKTREPFVVVEPLPPGRHVFELVVTDTAGNRSKPARIAVVVGGRSPPGGSRRRR